MIRVTRVYTVEHDFDSATEEQLLAYAANWTERSYANARFEAFYKPESVAWIRAAYPGPDPEFTAYRANGAHLCQRCGLRYRQHPLAGPRDESTGEPYLNLLCTGEFVKL